MHISVMFISFDLDELHSKQAMKSRWTWSFDIDKHMIDLFYSYDKFLLLCFFFCSGDFPVYSKHLSHFFLCNKKENGKWSQSPLKITFDRRSNFSAGKIQQRTNIEIVCCHDDIENLRLLRIHKFRVERWYQFLKIGACNWFLNRRRFPVPVFLTVFKYLL